MRLLLLLISTVLLVAQAPPDSAAYSVAYVDILPASRAAAITAIKQYRDASRKDDGFQRIEFFEQAGRPAHFCIIETWANSKDSGEYQRLPKQDRLDEAERLRPAALQDSVFGARSQ
jgi:quinol monooxygenase YgiN